MEPENWFPFPGIAKEEYYRNRSPDVKDGTRLR